ncbi:MAG: 16S rRNA (adenine(1518)-N(6)/adenine(1519)-N(6)) -dimethyltransferase RsmA [Myxococcales bacterium]
MNPAQLLRKHHLVPKKDWGQNFLGDEGVLAALAGLAGVGPGDTVVELGAGLGHLTRALAATGAHVVAVERDRELVPVLKAELDGLDVTVAEADAKTFDLRAVGREAGKRVVLCGNLPYHLSSPILFHLLDQRESVRRAVFLLQVEVADRIASPPDSRDYGLLSVLLQHVAEARIGLRVSRHAFTPPPDVESAALVLDLLPAPRAQVTSEERFRALVKAAFAQRRKTLWNALKSLPGGRDALGRAGIDPQRRGETLSVAEFAAVERALGPVPAAPAPHSA